MSLYGVSTTAVWSIFTLKIILDNIIFVQGDLLSLTHFNSEIPGYDDTHLLMFLEHGTSGLRVLLVQLLELLQLYKSKTLFQESQYLASLAREAPLPSEQLPTNQWRGPGTDPKPLFNRDN